MSEKNLEQLLGILKASGADAWEVADINERGWEFYFIRHQLDQHRAKAVDSFSVKVYRNLENGQFLGSASAKISPDASKEEMRRIVDGLCRDASYVKNPFYTLNRPAVNHEAAEPAPMDMKAVCGDFLRVMRSLPETETEDLNSYEIFVSEIRRRFLNSEGVDVTSVYPSSMVEAVVNARRDGHEIELYRLLKSGTCDPEQLSRELAEALTYGRDKLVASPTPALGKADVIFSTDPARELYVYFLSRLNTSMVYRGMSDWKTGDMVAPENLTLRAVRTLPNSSWNTPYDEEGAPVRDLTLIDHGKAAGYWGPRQFSQYMKVNDSFDVYNAAVSGGTESAEELRTGDYLEVVEFSDFQVDEITGDIAGEIRLAYLHRDGKVTPVSGGSVSGSMTELAKTMRFSAESRQYNCHLIPAVTRLQGVTVTGA